ncbi:MAG: hypothetical protein O7A06_01065, partial [Acidobacteria bacterium]|nr:hypothetical protein [Acidobacteriota bacterium]
GYFIPVVGSGKINNFEMAELILREGKADIIGMARSLLCDPDWTKKVRDGRQPDIRQCDYKSVCELLYDQRHFKVVCKLWGGLRHAGRVHPPG